MRPEGNSANLRSGLWQAVQCSDDLGCFAGEEKLSSGELRDLFENVVSGWSAALFKWRALNRNLGVEVGRAFRRRKAKLVGAALSRLENARE